MHSYLIRNTHYAIRNTQYAYHTQYAWGPTTNTHPIRTALHSPLWECPWPRGISTCLPCCCASTHGQYLPGMLLYGWWLVRLLLLAVVVVAHYWAYDQNMI
jgi:hypothetical protein